MRATYPRLILYQKVTGTTFGPSSSLSIRQFILNTCLTRYSHRRFPDIKTLTTWRPAVKKSAKHYDVLITTLDLVTGYCVRDISWFFSVPCNEVIKQCLKTDHDHFLSHPINLLLIIIMPFDAM